MEKVQRDFEELLDALLQLCHSERSEESALKQKQILRQPSGLPQDDNLKLEQGINNLTVIRELQGNIEGTIP